MPSFNVGKALKAGYAPDEILAFMATMPAPTAGLSDEALIERQLAGKPMLPVEYLPPIPPPALPPGLSGPPKIVGSVPQTGQRRNMSPAEIESLWSEPGIEAELSPPTSRLDLLMEPIASFIGEADLGKYALGATLLSMVKAGKPKKAGATLTDLSTAPRPGTVLSDIVQPAPMLEQAARQTETPLLNQAVEQTGLLSDLAKQRSAQMTPQQLEQLEAAGRTNPEFAEASKYLMPLEAQRLIERPENVQAFTTLLRELPSAQRLASVAKAGQAKQGWYEASTQAILDIFGKEDAPRFAQLLAAMSPQTSVESNLTNALNTWKNWVAAGRPVDPQQIKAVMGASVQGKKGEESVLGAWLPNAVRALSTKNPLDVTLSGAKVDSFYRNLVGNVHRVTNDAWMAAMLDISQGHFGGSATLKQLASGNPGMGPGYIAASQRMREAGRLAGMHPSESQETTWSLVKALYEKADDLGISPEEVLQKGLLTKEDIAATPDFSTLFKSPEYAGTLHQAGYGEQLEKLQPYPFPRQEPNLSTSEQEDVLGTARTLGDLAGRRGQESRSIQVPVEGQPVGHPTAQAEYIPGGATRHLTGMIKEPWGTREYFSGRIARLFQNRQDRDLLHLALGLKPLETRGVTGAYKPKRGPVQTNPAKALPIETAVGNYDIPPDVKTKLKTAEAVRGALTAQEGSTFNIGIPKQEGDHWRFPMKGKSTPEQMKVAQKRYPKLIFADTGAGVNVINFTGETLNATQLNNLKKVFNSAPPITTENVSEYVDYAANWAKKPGSGAVTKQMFEEVDKLTPADQESLDAAVRGIVGKLEEFYTKQGAKRKEPIRKDLMNLLRIIRDEGLPGARRAYESGAFVPALVGAVLAPAMLTTQSSDASSSPSH